MTVSFAPFEPEPTPAPCRRYTRRLIMHLPTPPPWMADMPPLHSPRAKAYDGLPSHASSQWQADGPIFSVDVRKLRILALRGRCWQCGYPVHPPGYVVVTETDINDRYGDLHTQTFGAMHASCALYACAACPFLRYPTSRRRVTGDTHRGTACIKGFNHHAVVFPPHPSIFMLFGCWSPTETIPITNQARVAELYEQAVTADAATKFTASPRLTWADTPDDMRRLRTTWSEDWQTLQSWARTSVVTINGQAYRGHTVDTAA